MNASDLNRNLLFHGQNDLNDFLRDSPLNRYLYEKMLDILPACGINVPVVMLFNEIYYQCVRVNYDGTPGVDIGRRYWSEEEAWIQSSEGAQVVFCAVWALLSVRESPTPHEKFFLYALAPYLRNCALGPFAEELARELRLNHISLPDPFPAMTCPVSEVFSKFTLTKEQEKHFWGYEDPTRLIIEESWRRAWTEVTCFYSPSVIEKYVRLYSDRDDQLKLITCMEAPLYAKQDSDWLCFLKDLSQRIVTGSFDPEDRPLLPPTASSEMEAEGSDEFRFDLGLDGTEGERNLDLAKQYREKCDALESQLKEMRNSHAMELARLEAEYKAEIKALREDNRKLIRWSWKKRPSQLTRSSQGSDVLVFNLNDVAAHVKERFSKPAAEEICAMLYRFAAEYGTLTKETIELIDSILPAIIYRDLPHQTFKFHNVSQFNNHPGTVVNHTEGE